MAAKTKKKVEGVSKTTSSAKASVTKKKTGTKAIKPVAKKDSLHSYRSAASSYIGGPRELAALVKADKELIGVYVHVYLNIHKQVGVGELGLKDSTIPSGTIITNKPLEYINIKVAPTLIKEYFQKAKPVMKSVQRSGGIRIKVPSFELFE